MCHGSPLPTIILIPKHINDSDERGHMSRLPPLKCLASSLYCMQCNRKRERSLAICPPQRFNHADRLNHVLGRKPPISVQMWGGRAMYIIYIYIYAGIILILSSPSWPPYLLSLDLSHTLCFRSRRWVWCHSRLPSCWAHLCPLISLPNSFCEHCEH